MPSSRRSRNLAPLKHSSCIEGSADTVLRAHDGQMMGRWADGQRAASQALSNPHTAASCSHSLSLFLVLSLPTTSPHIPQDHPGGSNSSTHLSRMNARSAFSSSRSSREAPPCGPRRGGQLLATRAAPIAAAAAAAEPPGSSSRTLLEDGIRGLVPLPSPCPPAAATAAAAATATDADPSPASAACAPWPPWLLPSQSPLSPSRSAGRRQGAVPAGLKKGAAPSSQLAPPLSPPYKCTSWIQRQAGVSRL